MTKYSILQRFSFAPFFGSGAKPSIPLDPFNEKEVEDLNNIWDSAWIQNAHHDENGVHLLTQEGANVHIQRDKITVSADAEDATLRSLVLHAKTNWGGRLAPLSNDPKNVQQLAHVWAHCQVHGVKFAWEPPAEMAPKLAILVDNLRDQEQALTQGSSLFPAYGKEGLKYRPPVLESVKIPVAGSRPNHASLKAEAAALPIATPQLSPLLNGVAEQANLNARREREAYLQARAEGRIHNADEIEDFGTRTRMKAVDRAIARQQERKSLSRGPGLSL